MNSSVRHSLTLAQLKAIRLSAYVSEWAGTTVILLNGLSWACWNFGAGSPLVQWLPNRAWRVLLQAICVAGGAMLVIYSPLGKRAGGHLNPAMTFGFWLLRKISTRDAVIYIAMQFLGAFTGTGLASVLFPELFHSIHDGTTILGAGVSPALGFAIEMGATWLLMVTVLVTVNSSWMRWTGAIAGAEFALIYIELGRLTGASLNPARSLAPAVLAQFWQHQWIYWVAPPLGVALAVLLYRWGKLGTHKSYCCKLYHTDDIPCHHFRCGYSNSADIDDFARGRR